tara:strand:- start:364 stop:1026 length:663 start_codon:yes stop_codon:yes gene_type:complete
VTINQAILYSFRRCPFAMRARMAIYLSSFSCEIREVHLSQKPLEMIKLSPKGTVPVLLLPTGRVIDESMDLMKYVLSINNPMGIMTDYTQNKDEVDRMLYIFDNKFKYHLDRYKYSSRYEKVDPLEHRQKALKILEALTVSPIFDTNKNFITNPKLIDISLLPFVRQYRIADPEWFDTEMPCTEIKNWLSDFLDSKLFNEIMIKYKRWEALSERVYFPPN